MIISRLKILVHILKEFVWVGSIDMSWLDAYFRFYKLFMKDKSDVYLQSWFPNE